MAESRNRCDVLLVQFWIHDPEPVRAALRAVGLDPRIVRVDIEPALNAAVTIEGFDLAIYAGPPSLRREVAGECLRGRLQLVEVEPLATLGERVRVVLAAQRN